MRRDFVCVWLPEDAVIGVVDGESKNGALQLGAMIVEMTEKQMVKLMDEIAHELDYVTTDKLSAKTEAARSA